MGASDLGSTQIGTILPKVYMPQDRKSGACKGYAFLNFYRPEHADSGIVVTLWRPTEAGKPKWCNGIKFWMGGIGAVWDAGEALWVVDAYVLNGFLISSFLLATAVLIFSYQAL